MKPELTRILLMFMVCSAVLTSLAAFPQTAWAAAAGNSTQTSVGPGTVSINLATGAVVTFIIMVLGLAAGILLMGRFLNPRTRS